jgi:hypothetical protein
MFRRGTKGSSPSETTLLRRLLDSEFSLCREKKASCHFPMRHESDFLGNHTEERSRRAENNLPLHLQWFESTPTKGLVVLEMLGLDDETCLLVVAETIPDSEEPLQYGLIFDSNKISLDILKPLHDKGYMYFPDTGKQWTPK